MNIKALLLVGVLILFGIGAFALSADTSEDGIINSNTSQQSASETSAPASIEETNGQLLKREEVAINNSENSCWTIIGDSVYDITSYVPRHPGGDEVLRACGTDGTSLFTERTTADGEKVGSGSSHSSGASNQLSGFRIGTLDTEQE